MSGARWPSRSAAAGCAPGSGSAPNGRSRPSSGSAGRRCARRWPCWPRAGWCAGYRAGAAERSWPRARSSGTCPASSGCRRCCAARAWSPGPGCCPRGWPRRTTSPLRRCPSGPVSSSSTWCGSGSRMAARSPWSTRRFPARRFPGLLELPLGGSVYELLEQHFGAEPADAVERIEVVQASADEAAILDVEPGAPLMAITRTTTDSDGEPFEFSRDLFRADRTRIVVRTEGGGPRPRPAGPGWSNCTPRRPCEHRRAGAQRKARGADPVHGPAAGQPGRLRGREPRARADRAPLPARPRAEPGGDRRPGDRAGRGAGGGVRLDRRLHRPARS